MPYGQLRSHEGYHGGNRGGFKVDKLTEMLRSLGTAQATRYVLPRLAMEISKAAADRDIKPEDALELYVDYFKAASGLKTIDPYDNSIKANVSKLRQIIKAADPELMGRVIRQYDKLSRQIEVKPLYHSMVEAARYKNTHGKRPTNGHLAKLIKK